MLLNRDTRQHIGKTVARIDADSAFAGEGIHMATTVTIYFTDGTAVKLGTDWRGGECYLSEYSAAPAGQAQEAA